jgi:predicted nuclease of predicted toxin-antitoxin system
MKLLFDANLSHRLIELIGDIYPGSSHVRIIGLQKANDNEVWEYAIANGYTVVTKDADFHEYSILRGFPPKVIWIRKGNCSTEAIAKLLRTHNEKIQAFYDDAEISHLILY